jgi:hypothetical protein
MPSKLRRRRPLRERPASAALACPHGHEPQSWYRLAKIDFNAKCLDRRFARSQRIRKTNSYGSGSPLPSSRAGTAEGSLAFMWRLATASDDEAIVSMCMALNAEDPGLNPVQPQQVRRTLAKLREEPNRDGSTLAPTIINLPSTPSPSIRLPIALPSGAVARITRAPPKANSSFATSCDLAHARRSPRRFSARETPAG